MQFLPYTARTVLHLRPHAARTALRLPLHTARTALRPTLPGRRWGGVNTRRTVCAEPAVSGDLGREGALRAPVFGRHSPQV